MSAGPIDDGLPVLVMGMHRSGTSAVAGALRAAGLYAGSDAEMIAARKDNPAGYTERLDVVELNDALLFAKGRQWDTPPADPPVPNRADEREVMAVRALVARAMAGRSRWLIKDPRISLLLPAWRRALEDRFVAVVAVRRLDEVVRSLQGRNGFAPDLGVALWAAYARHLARGLEGLAVVLVQFAALTEDPEGTITSLFAALDELGVRGPFDRDAAVASIAPVLRGSSGTRASAGSPTEHAIRQLEAAWATAPVVVHKRFSTPISPPSDHERAVLAAHAHARRGSSEPYDAGRPVATPRRFGVVPHVSKVGLRRAGYRIALHLPASLYANPLFDREWYLQHNPDVRDSGTNPYRHYRRHGIREGRDPNPWFDTAWYADANPDVRHTGMEPLDHYLLHGGREGRRPSPRFDAALYLHQNPDVAASGVNPLLHFILFGRAEGRETSLAVADSGLPADAAATRGAASSGDADAGSGGSRPADGRLPPAREPLAAGVVPDVRLIAFFLPQFHPIPENDRWWGPGYSEWRPVAAARPLFPGHAQPHIPADLGFYDLRLPETRQAQADLARGHGIHGFCWYHYWFEGSRLLQRPFDEVLASGTPDLPFALCWANDPWSRRWDGRTEELLKAQAYSPEDDLAHIRWLLPALADRRAIRVGGKPLFLVYRAASLPDGRRTTDLWRREVERAGLPGLHLVAVETAWDLGLDARPSGFDAKVLFQPQFGWLEVTARRAGVRVPMPERPELKVYDYDAMRAQLPSISAVPYTRYDCVVPAWDNTPRVGGRGVVLQGSTPDGYAEWLTGAVRRARDQPEEERLVFINAWNEWAEGCYLEPDRRNGHAYLQATLEALYRAGSLREGPSSDAPEQVPQSVTQR